LSCSPSRAGRFYRTCRRLPGAGKSRTAGVTIGRRSRHRLAESTDNELAIEVLKDIADEEAFYAEGAEEVEEEISKAE